MTRFLVGVLGVVLLAVVALAVIWLAGQVLVGVGALAVGTAGVLLRLLWFLMVAGGLGGLVFFVANAWRPSHAGGTGPVRLDRLPSFPVADLRMDPATPEAGTPPPLPGEGAAGPEEANRVER